MPTDSRYLYKPTVGLSSGSARTLKKPAAERPADKRLEKGQETRRAIVETATRLFAERGYAAVSIERCWPPVRSAATPHHHFSSKEALLEAAFEAVEIDVTNKVLGRRSQRQRRYRGGASRLRGLPRPHSGSDRAPDHADRRPFSAWLGEMARDRLAPRLRPHEGGPGACRQGGRHPGRAGRRLCAYVACIPFGDRPFDRRGGRCAFSVGERQGGCSRASGPPPRPPSLEVIADQPVRDLRTFGPIDKSFPFSELFSMMSTSDLNGSDEKSAPVEAQKIQRVTAKPSR